MLFDDLRKQLKEYEVDIMLYEDVVKWWKDLSRVEKESVLDNFQITSTWNSSAIEGSTLDYHTTREVFEGDDITNFSGKTRDLFEAQNSKYAFSYMLKYLESGKSVMCKEFVLKLHRVMLYGCYDERRWGKGERPGKFKVHDYCVGVSSVGSYPDEVEDDLDELFEEVGSTEGDPLTIAAYLHARFETIHPFADGNGRVGRMLMIAYLLSVNHPPIIIFNDDKETYYLALEVYNRTEDLTGFKQFLKEACVKTWECKMKRPLKKLNAFL